MKKIIWYLAAVIVSMICLVVIVLSYEVLRAILIQILSPN